VRRWTRWAKTIPNARGVILAGSQRWGESAFERVLPRPLVPVADSPLLSFALRWLRDAGVNSTTICANSESRLIRQIFADGRSSGLQLTYFEDLSPRGPAGCVRDAGLEWQADHLIVVEGSVIPSLDLSQALEAHIQSDAAMTVIVEETGSRHAPESLRALRPVGIYLVSNRTLDKIQSTGYHDIKEGLIPMLHDQGELVLPYMNNRHCPRITNIDSYLATSEWAINRIITEPMGEAWGPRTGQTRMNPTSSVHPTVRLIGPVLVGPGVQIDEGVTVVGPSVIGRDCQIHAQALVCRSALWDLCTIGQRAIVDHSVLAFEADVAPGDAISNRLYQAQSSSVQKLRRTNDPDSNHGMNLMQQPTLRSTVSTHQSTGVHQSSDSKAPQCLAT
jgi:NDP-sugar pyrophosphorylase family protein